MAGKILLLGLLIVLGGIISVAIGISARSSDQLLKKWPTVRGTILSSSIIRTTRARLRVGATRGGASPDPSYAVDPVWGRWPWISDTQLAERSISAMTLRPALWSREFNRWTQVPVRRCSP